MDAHNNSGLGMGRLPRHTAHQIQRLEANCRYFKGCPHPDENQRKELGKELGLEPMQVMFWFQNKRNQTKVHTDCVDNHAFRVENDQMRYENQALSELLKTVICPACDGHPPVGEEARKHNLHKLRIENAKLKEAHEKLSNEVTSRTGRPISHLLALPPDSLEYVLNSSAGSCSGQQKESSSLGPDVMFTNSQNPTAANELIEISEQEKEVIFANAASAIDELSQLSLAIEPFWVMSPSYGGYVLHLGNYYRLFPKSSHLKKKSSRIESSKDSTLVPITASDLVEMFRDMDKWVDLFPTIVMEAKLIETLDTGSPGDSLHLPSIFKENNMVLLQESSIDPSGALVVFAPVDSQVIMEVMNGEDTKKIPVLPCGFLISSDGQSNGNRSDGASTSAGTAQSRPLGSLLTLAFLFPARDSPGATQNHMEAINMINSLVTSIIQNFKVAIGCPELD